MSYLGEGERGKGPGGLIIGISHAMHTADQWVDCLDQILVENSFFEFSKSLSFLYIFRTEQLLLYAHCSNLLILKITASRRGATPWPQAITSAGWNRSLWWELWGQ